MANYLRRQEDRINAILTDSPDKIYFESQSYTDIPNYQRYSVENKVWYSVAPMAPQIQLSLQNNIEAANVINDNNQYIISAANEFGIDADLLRAILYTEVARGYYGYMGEWLGISKTILPGNIDPSIWGG